jgi:hypothetical protein
MKVVFHAVYHEFTRADIETLAMQAAKSRTTRWNPAVTVGKQKVRWLPDGLEVTTKVTREDDTPASAVPRPRRRRRS